MTQTFIIVFIIIATAFPMMRLNGSRDADLPAFGALIIALLLASMLNGRIMALEKTLKELKENANFVKTQSENKQI